MTEEQEKDAEEFISILTTEVLGGRVVPLEYMRIFVIGNVATYCHAAGLSIKEDGGTADRISDRILADIERRVTHINAVVSHESYAYEPYSMKRKRL